MGLVALLALVVWLLTPSEESAIQKRLRSLATEASFGPTDSGIARLAYGNNLRDFFADDAELTVEIEGRGAQSIHGRAEVLQFASFARNKLTQAKLQLLDITIKLGEDGVSARAYMTLLGDLSGEKNAVSQELKVSLKKFSHDWLITRIETIRTLK